MSVKKLHSEINTTYFCTFTCHNWISLFEITNFYDEVYKWLNILITKNVQIIGFVIMPNHLHCLLHLNDKSTSINKITGTGKRFMAYEIVRRLKAIHKKQLLKELSEAVLPSEKARN